MAKRGQAVRRPPTGRKVPTKGKRAPAEVDLKKEIATLRRELAEALERQTATSEVLQVISSAPGDLDPVFQSLLENATRVCGAKFGTMHLLEGDMVRRVALYNVPPAYADALGTRTFRPHPEGGLGQVIRTKQVAQIADIRTNPAYLEGSPVIVALSDLGGARTLVSVPMLRDAELVGTIVVYRQEVRPFTDKQIELLSNFAKQAVIAIENTRLLKELRESLQQQTATAEVLKVISRSAFDLQPILDTIVQTASRLCDAEFAQIYKLQDDKYHLAATNNTATDFVRYSADHPLSPGRGSLVGRTALDRKTVHLPDCLADPEYEALEYQSMGQYRSILGVPLLREGVPIGVIALMRAVVLPFTDKQIELVSTFADQAVIAIENVRLFDEVQARTEDLRESLQQQTATADVLKVISRSTFDLQKVLDTLTESACQLCDAFDAVLFMREGESLSFAAHYGPIPIDVTKWPLTRAWTNGRAVIDRKSIHVHDLQAEKAEFPDGYTMARRMGHRTSLSIPLLRGDEAIGSLTIRRSEIRPFTAKQIELAETFADQAVIAIENVRLFEEVQSRTRDLAESLEQQTATSEVLQVISASPGELEPVFQKMLENATRVCGANFGQMNLYEEGSFGPVAFYNMPAAYTASWAHTQFQPHPQSGLGTVARTHQVVHIEDIRTLPPYLEGNPSVVAIADLAGARTYFVVPMLKGNELIGAITIYRQEVKPFTVKQIELVANFANQAVIAIENTRLLKELRESLQQQTATADVLKVISRSVFNLQAVLDALVESAAHLCDTDRAVLTRKQGDRYYRAALHGFPDEAIAEMKSVPVDLESGMIVARALRNCAVVHVADVNSDPEYPGSPAQTLGGVRTVLSVPLIRETQPVGAITVSRTRVEPFTEKQIDLIKTFADQAVIAIENARLFEEVQARTEDLRESLQQQTATSDVLKIISRSTFDLQTVLDTLVESATRLCDAGRAIIWRPFGDVYKIAAAFNLTASHKEKLEELSIRPGRGTAIGRTLLGGKTVHIHDAQADPEYDWPEIGRVGGSRTILSVPLVREGLPIGVLVLSRVEAQPFTGKQIELATTFADQAVIAIENVRLFEEVQARTAELSQSVDELRALGEVSQAVNSTVDLETVLNTIVAKATQLSSTEAGAIYVFDQTVQEFHLRATYGMDDAIISEIKDRHIHIGDTVVGEAVQRRLPIQIPDIQNDPNPAVFDVIVRAGFRALLIVPLLGADRTVGALVVRRKQPGEFANHTVDLLQTFAAQSVLAIQNARLFESVEARTRELAVSLEELRAAQDRLVQTQKLASLGQLTAGIAHEIKNPLNFVNNFSALSNELIDELSDALKPVAFDDKKREELDELTHMLKGNLEKVVQHGKRADSIVKNMLLHSREGSGEHRSVDVNDLVEDSLNLAYHGARAEKPGFNITLKRSFDPNAGEVDVFPQEITRALLNLISNGFYAATKRAGKADSDGYEPTLAAATKNLGDSVEIRIRDSGTGIPPEVREKMFNPFFTTKPPGEGTGLGLSLSYDIVVKQHSGSIEVDTRPGEFTEFRVILPRMAARSKPGAIK